MSRLKVLLLILIVSLTIVGTQRNASAFEYVDSNWEEPPTQPDCLATDLCFEEVKKSTNFGPNTGALDIGRLNGGNNLDFVATDSSQDKIRIKTGCGNGSWCGTWTWTMGDGPTDVAAADFDGDGQTDIIATNFNDDQVRIRWGSSGWSSYNSYSTDDDPIALTIGDMNQDGLDDFLTENATIGTNGDSITVRLRQSGGGFSQATYSTATGLENIILNDCDGDNDLDLIYTTRNTSAPPSQQSHDELFVRRNNGSGTFGVPSNKGVNTPNQGFYQAIASGDMNEDGDDDIVLARNDHKVVRLLGDGNCDFVSHVSVDTPSNPTSLDLADMDNDGHLDLLVGHFTVDDNLYIYRGLGNGNVGSPLLVPTVPATVNDMGTGDFNGDGRLDILFSTNSGVYQVLSRNDSPAVTDLSITAMEVTQAVQDLGNNIPLVANKRTFVRLHVESSLGTHNSNALLQVTKGNNSSWVLPLNNSQNNSVNFRPNPDRAALQDSFLFELPSAYRTGEVDLRGIINVTTQIPFESNLTNNEWNETITFNSVPKPNLVVYNVNYTVGNTYHETPNWERNQMYSWLRRAYPVDGLIVHNRDMEWGTAQVSGNSLTNPDCDLVNFWLNVVRLFSDANNPNIPLSTRYYGMVTSEGGFMRGCSQGSGNKVASGPTGDERWQDWDTDGSYGDWYGGHELGHSYGRPHAAFCEANGNPDNYPYPNGSISPTSGGPAAIYGFDSLDRSIYDTSWADVMTYCDFQWVGGFTYVKLYEKLRTYLPETRSAENTRTTADRILLVGGIDEDTNTVTLETPFVIPNAATGTEARSGTHSIIMKDANGVTLESWPFTPYEHEHEEDSSSSSDSDHAEEGLATFAELVELPRETSYIEIALRDGTVLHTLKAGSAEPTIDKFTVELQQDASGAPTGVMIELTASDADEDDVLAARLEVSHDNGDSWTMMPSPLDLDSGGSYAGLLDPAKLPGGTQVLFRAQVSDGLHTVSAVSAEISLPNHAPTVEIITPIDDAQYTAGQTVGLEAMAFDFESGSLSGMQLVWSSSLDGFIGNGESLSISTLSVGTHDITLVATDRGQATGSATVRIVISGSADAVEFVDALQSAQPIALLSSDVKTDTIVIHNAAGPSIDFDIDLTGSTDLRVDIDQGTTPQTIVVHYSGNGEVSGSAAAACGESSCRIGTLILTETSGSGSGRDSERSAPLELPIILQNAEIVQSPTAVMLTQSDAAPAPLIWMLVVPLLIATIIIRRRID